MTFERFLSQVSFRSVVISFPESVYILLPTAEDTHLYSIVVK